MAQTGSVSSLPGSSRAVHPDAVKPVLDAGVFSGNLIPQVTQKRADGRIAAPHCGQRAVDDSITCPLLCVAMQADWV